MKKITSHAAGAVVVYVDRSRALVNIANMVYTNKRGSSIRLMMETGEPNESVIETLRNGMLKEFAASEGDFDYRLVQSEPILVELSDDERNPGGLHLKAFFLVEVLRGKLRDTPLEDGRETLGPVNATEAAKLIGEMEGKTTPIHTRAAKAALVTLASDKRFFDRYQDIILHVEENVLNDKEREAIAAYPWKW